MSNKKGIQYFIDRDTGEVGSRFGNEIAVAILEFDKIGKDGDYTKPLTYHLERMPIMESVGLNAIWTRKLPLAIRNEQRQFWGLKPVDASSRYCPECGKHINKCRCPKDCRKNKEE